MSSLKNNISKQYQPLTVYMRKTHREEPVKPQRYSVQAKSSLAKQSKSITTLSKPLSKEIANRKSSHRRILSWIPQKTDQVLRTNNQNQIIEKIIQILSPWEGVKTFQDVLNRRKQFLDIKRKTREQQRNYSLEDHLKLITQNINQSVKICENTKNQQGQKLLALIQIFKKIISDLTTMFIEEQIKVIQRYQSSIHQIGKQYDKITEKCQSQTLQLDKQKLRIKQLKNALSMKKHMGCFVSAIFAQMQLKGINIEQWIVNSQHFERQVLTQAQRYDKRQQIKAKNENINSKYSLNYSKNGESIQKTQFDHIQ